MIDEQVLERRLRALAAELDYPPTPALAAPVRRLLPARLPWWRRLRVRLLAAVVAALAVVLGVTPVRTAIANWLGIHGVLVTPVQSPPASEPPLASGTASLLPGVALQLGTPVTLTQARAAVGFPVAVPTALGAPDEVYLRSDAGGVVSLVYHARPGMPAARETGVAVLITEFRGDIAPWFIGKLTGPGTDVVPVTVSGGAGLWFGGAPSGLVYELPSGEYQDTPRLAAPTLVFERGTVTVRIEAPQTEQQVLALAASLQ